MLGSCHVVHHTIFAPDSATLARVSRAGEELGGTLPSQWGALLKVGKVWNDGVLRVALDGTGSFLDQPAQERPIFC